MDKPGDKSDGPARKAQPFQVDRHGIPVLDGMKHDPIFDSMLQGLFEAQEQGDMVRYDAVAVQMEAGREIITGLDREFQVLREKLALNTFSAKNRISLTKEEFAEKSTKFVAETATGKGSRYGGPAVPNQRFFLDKMLPAICMVTQTPEEIQRATHVAFDALERILTWNFTGHHSGWCNSHVMESFFDTSDAAEGYGIGNCAGQFAHYYKKYGSSYALAVAQLQGWLADEHYEGGSSYCISGYRIEDKFKNVREACPPAYHDQLMRIYMNVCRSNHYWGESFIQEFAPTLLAFRDAGKEHLIPVLMDLVDAIGFHDNPGDSYNYVMPFFNPVAMINEIEAFIAHPLREDLLAWTRLIANDRRSIGSSPVSFIRTSETQDDEDVVKRYHRSLTDNLVDKIHAFQEAGYTPEKIRSIIHIGEEHPWLGNNASRLIGSWLELEGKFPGGAEGMIQYLKQLVPARQCIRQCLWAATSGFSLIPSSIDAPVFTTGVALVKRLGNAAEVFFRDKMFRNDEWKYHDDKGENPIDPNSPEEILKSKDSMRRVRAASKIAADFPQNVDGSVGGRGKIFEWLLRFKTKDGSPQDFEKAIALFKEAWLAYPDTQEKSRHREVWSIASDLNHVLEAFEKIRSYIERICEEDTNGRKFPSFEEMARYVIFLSLDLRDGSGSLIHDYGKLLFDDKSMDPYVAMVMVISSRASHALAGVDLMKLPVPEELLDDVKAGQKIAVFMKETRDLSRKVLDEGGIWQRQIYHSNPPSRYELQQRAIVGKLVRQHDFETRLKELKRLSTDPRFARVYNFKEIEEDITTALNAAKVSELLQFNIRTDAMKGLEGSEFFNGTNPGTKLAIVGTSMMMALQGPAGRHAKGLGLEMLPALMGVNGAALSERVVQAKGKRSFDALARNIAKLMPLVEAQILQSRRSAVGFMPQGLKIHTPDTMNPEIFAMLSAMFGIGSSPFGMKGLGEGILLPVMPTPTELKMLDALLGFFGGINPATRDFQTTMAGRLEEHEVAVEATTVLLGTPVGRRYGDNAFSTENHDSATGGRIAIFDAGVREEGFPFDVSAAKGRTDLLGRRAPEDIDIQHVAGTLATHFQFGGPFEHLFTEFNRRHHEVLRRYGLEGALHASAWVENHADEHDSLAFHGAMVDRFSAEWMKSSHRVDYGVIREMGQLVTDMAQRMHAEQPRIITEMPEEFEKLMKF
ncbi:MAG: hypothetical protein NTX63_03520 [Candidatus Peregrinibacteria bacterium]|nr:hypothetical protein [Candidatus Peregrinibacteria bacterium]